MTITTLWLNNMSLRSNPMRDCIRRRNKLHLSSKTKASISQHQSTNLYTHWRTRQQRLENTALFMTLLRGFQGMIFFCKITTIIMTRLHWMTRYSCYGRSLSPMPTYHSSRSGTWISSGKTQYIISRQNRSKLLTMESLF